MKYSKKKTYYAVIDGKVREMKFLRVRKTNTVDVFGGVHLMHGYKNDEEFITYVFVYENDNGLKVETVLRQKYVFSDYASAETSQGVIEMGEHLYRLQGDVRELEERLQSKWTNLMFTFIGSVAVLISLFIVYIFS